VVDVDRSLFRARRGALARSVRRDASAAVAARAAALDAITSARRIGTYLPHSGELDPAAIVRAAWQRGASVFVPVVPDGAPGPLTYTELTAHTALVVGRYGIAVPANPVPSRAVDELDVVLVPLVAFDRRLTRVGSGAGYYDRTFAARLLDAGPPLLVGLAYAWQQVDDLRREAWDVALDLVITDQHVVQPGDPTIS
jgi:5-formyltetrahydrofolate cyclo-ligase